jgi:hypothetical protein
MTTITAITRIIRCWLASRRRRARVTAAEVESSKTVGRPSAAPARMAGTGTGASGTGFGRAHWRLGVCPARGAGDLAAAVPPSSSNSSSLAK